MFFKTDGNKLGYRIGKVTIDKSFHTQSADESFFRYFCNDTLYSMTRTIHPDDLELFKNIVVSLSDDEVRHSMIRMKNASGEYRWMIVKMSVNRHMLSRGVRYTDIVVKDAVILEKNTTALEKLLDRFRYLLSVQEAIIFEYNSESNKFGVYSFDYNVNTIFFNVDFDYFKFQMISENRISDGSRETFESFFESIKSGISRFSFEMETSMLTGGDQMQLQIFSGFTVSDGEQGRTVLGLITDKSQQESISGSNVVFETNLDPLTKLFNKKAISDYAVSRIKSGSVKSVTIVIIDLDNFKYINDRYGHLFGDEIICIAASVIKQETGSRGTAGRIGGDEFMLVLDDINDEMELRSILRAIRSNIEVMCAEKTIGLHMTCSMGTAMFPENASSYKQLFRTADKALYIAKEKGKDRYVIYNKEKHGIVEGDETAISINSSTKINKFEKAEIVGNIIMCFLSNKTMELSEVLEITLNSFELDSINIYSGNDMECIYSFPESDLSKENADYIFKENYIDNFGSGNVFAIDNTDVLEDRNSEAYKILIERNINASVQYILIREGNISAMITFNLKGHFKKWPQSDINYMMILGKIILEELVNGGDIIG